MLALTEREIRGSFVNCSRGEVARLTVPDLDLVAWPELDYLGWVDPRAPLQAAVVVPHEGEPMGVRLRRNQGGSGRARMCSWCCTVHPGSGVALMVANRAGRAGRDGNTTGAEVCADLRCSAYARGTLPAPSVSTVAETIPAERRTERLQDNLGAFLRRVLR